MSDNAYATLQDVIDLSGATYTSEQQARIKKLLPMVSNTLRNEAHKVGKDLDMMIASGEVLEDVVTLVTVDVVVRAMRQSTDGEPMSQESQSALGYSWSGTFAIPGGGIANAIMRNDLKRLGLWGQKYGVIDFYGCGCRHEQD